MQDSCRCGHHQCGLGDIVVELHTLAGVEVKAEDDLGIGIVGDLRSVFIGIGLLSAGRRRDHVDAAKRATTPVADDGQIPWRSLSGSYNPTNQYQKPAVETSLPSQAFGYCKASSIVRNRSDGCASNGSSNVTSILFGEVSDSRVQSQEYCALCDRADWMNRPRSAARVSWGGTSMASCACDSLTNVRMAPRRHSEAYSAPLATSW